MRRRSRRARCGPTRRAPSCAPSGPSRGRPIAPPPPTTIDQLKLDPGAYVVWLSDGLEDEGARQAHRAPAQVRRPAGRRCPTSRPRRCCCCRRPPKAATSRCRRCARWPTARARSPIQAADDQGRVVARIELDFAATATKGEGVAAGAARAAQPHGPARHRGAGRRGQRPCCSTSAAAAGLSPSWASAPTATGQPLLQEVYFLERALDPYVSLIDRRSRDGADAQHRRAADPRRRRAVGQRPRGDRQVDRARRHRRALRRSQPRRGRRHAGADARCAWATARWAAS